MGEGTHLATWGYHWGRREGSRSSRRGGVREAWRSSRRRREGCTGGEAGRSSWRRMRKAWTSSTGGDDDLRASRLGRRQVSSRPSPRLPFRARGLLPVLFFPRGASFPALEGVCARAHRGSGKFRVTGRDDRLRARLGRLRAPNRRLRAAWSRLGAALA